MRDRRRELQEQEGEQELQMADGSDSPSYKQEWQAFILELSWCNLWLQESEGEMKAGSEAQLQSFPALGN